MNDKVAEKMKVSALEVLQPIGTFYVATIPASTLIEICFEDIRRIENREIETYTGLNRPLSTERKEIKAYIETVDSTFPNSIIVCMEKKRIKILAQKDGCLQLEIEKRKDSAKIIDGQHRLAGFRDASFTDFDLIVSIFVDLDLEEQAAIFSNINLKQTKVSPSLVYDLFELSHSRSPEKTAHDIAKGLNRDPKSPFHLRIKILGRDPDDPEVPGQKLYKGVITQATFVRELVNLISDETMADRDLLKRGKPIPGNIEEDLARGLIFRDFFRKEEDWAILKVYKNFFSAFQEVFPEYWDSEDSIWAKTVGYSALVRILKKFYLSGYKQKKASLEYFKSALNATKQKLKTAKVNFDDVEPGGKAVKTLSDRFLEHSEL